MSEMIYVTKCFLFALILMVMSQLKWGEKTIEEKSLAWLHQSQAGTYLQSVASGGALIVNKALNKARSGFQDLRTSLPEFSQREERASR